MPESRPGNPAERVRQLLRDPDTFGTTMFVLAVDTFGPECLGDPDDPDRGAWHPSTFRLGLQQHFGAEPLPANIDKLMAAVTVVTTDLFFKSPRAFVHLANVLAGDEFDPEVFDPADSLECAWAITEALLLSPPDEGDDETFAPEIRYYIGHVLRTEGYVTPPDILRIALDGDFSAKVQYEFADDPEMFQGIYEVQQAKAQDVEAVLREGLTDLRRQLAALPLKTGDVRELDAGIKRMLDINRPEESTTTSIM